MSERSIWRKTRFGMSYYDKYVICNCHFVKKDPHLRFGWFTGRALQVSSWLLYFLQILKPITLPWTSSRLQKKTCAVDRRLCLWIWNKRTSHFFLTKISTRLYVYRRSLTCNLRPVAVDCFIFIFSVLKRFPSNYFHSKLSARLAPRRWNTNPHQVTVLSSIRQRSWRRTVIITYCK